MPGTYNVKLIATNGCTDTTAIEQIIVYGLPTAEFFVSRNEACIGDSIFSLINQVMQILIYGNLVMGRHQVL